MGTLIPQTRDEWMRWIERRVTAQERRTNSNPSAVDPLQIRASRYLARLNAAFVSSPNVLYNIGLNATSPTPQHFDPDGLFTYQQVVPGGQYGVVVSRPGLYAVTLAVQWDGIATNTNGTRQIYIHRHTDDIAMFSDEATGAAIGYGTQNNVSGVMALQAGQGVVIKVRNTSNQNMTVVKGPSANPLAPLSGTTLSIAPIGAYDW